MDNLFIGLGDSGFIVAKEICSRIANSEFIAVDAWSPRGESGIYNINRGKNYEYFLDRRELVEAHKWLRLVPHHQMRSHVYELSRAEIRLVYEINQKSTGWIKHILPEINQNSSVHIIVPMYDNVALATAKLMAWDIKNELKTRNISARIIAHLILPDTQFFPISSKSEIQYYYCMATAFVKELKYICDLCNYKKEISASEFIITNRFDSNNKMLPFDFVATHGNLQPLENNIRVSVHDVKTISAIVDSIINTKLLNCKDIDFSKKFDNENQLFAADGRATKAYSEYQNTLKPSILNMLHLDYNWDMIFKT